MNLPNERSWPADLDRYSRQMLFAPVGPAGQQRLAAARAVLIGVGALGTHQAAALVRSGLGFLRIVDRDVVELVVAGHDDDERRRAILRLQDNQRFAQSAPRRTSHAGRAARIARLG